MAKCIYKNLKNMICGGKSMKHEFVKRTSAFLLAGALILGGGYSSRQ